MKKLNKIISMSRVVKNILISRIFNKRMPIFLSLCLTNACNLRCTYCYANIDNRFDNNPHEGFTKEEVFKIIDEFYSMGARMVFLLGGEPLVHNNIGDIVKYITKKGMHLDILTNGTLVEKKIEEIKTAHNICFSLDGDEEFNDSLRGKGVFNKALSGIDICKKNNVGARVHAVMTKGSLKQLKFLANLCKQKKIILTYSPPNYLGNSEEQEIFKISDEEYKEFWLVYKELKKKGYPIGNSYAAIDKVLNWPINYHDYIKPDEKFDNYKPIFCASGHTYCAVDSDGTLCNCINLGMKTGLNIREVGIKKAWEKLPDFRKNCYSCASLNTVETSIYMQLEPSIFFDAIKYNILIK